MLPSSSGPQDTVWDNLLEPNMDTLFGWQKYKNFSIGGDFSDHLTQALHFTGEITDMEESHLTLSLKLVLGKEANLSPFNASLM